MCCDDEFVILDRIVQAKPSQDQIGYDMVMYDGSIGRSIDWQQLQCHAEMKQGSGILVERWMRLMSVTRDDLDSSTSMAGT
jgi:hypothetical protein